MDIPEFTLPDWLTGCDSDTIQKRMMESLPPDIDKTEGGFPWDFTAPTALEISEILQFHIPETLKLMHPMWAYGKWLDYHAAAACTARDVAEREYSRKATTASAPTLEEWTTVIREVGVSRVPRSISRVTRT